MIKISNKLIVVLTYFIDTEPHYKCTGLIRESCNARKTRLEAKYGTAVTVDDDTIRKTYRTAQYTVQSGLQTNLTNINNDTNLVSAGDHRDMMEALYVSKGLMTDLTSCYADYIKEVKEQFVDKITEELIEGAADMIADLLGVGIAKLVVGGLVTTVLIIEDVYRYTTSDDDEKPKYIGAIVGEITKFVISNVRRKMRKVRRMKKLRKMRQHKL